jgi:glycine/D-amino acid oxidase-like deaminating enzyme
VLSLKQQASGAVVVGGGWLGDPTLDGRSYTLRKASRVGNWATACELFPPVRLLRCVGAWGGLQAQSLDDLPFIGRVPGLEGLTLAVGSWYGFALAPAVGRSVADQLAGRPTPELDQLSPQRIFDFDPAEVAVFQAEPAAANMVE